MAVEEEVGLWTTEAGDDHVLTSQTEVAGKKPKRTLTTERKKKRQQAKHRKRFQKEEALGIRKLRLKPPVIKKERVIKFCEFYIKGKCSKGASCTFSHDVVPRTKSEMCKYFINRCCLKGDDCPFSHALSSFPCKFFHTRGYCLDADTCRFSHEPISEEARHELQRKIEQEQQVRQGNVVTSSDVTSGKIASIDVSPRLLKSENHMPLFDPKVFPLRGKPADNKVEGSVKGKHAERRNPSLSRDVKEGSAAGIGNAETGFTHTEGSDNNAMLLAARKAASTFTFGPSNATNSGVNRSLLYGGLLGATGSPLNRTTVLDASTPSGLVRKENPGQSETPGAAFIMGVPGNSTWTQDPKVRAMEILQASLGASQLMSRSKSATGMEDVQGFDTLFGRLKPLLTVQNILLEPPGISTPRDPKARAMEILQVSLGSSQPPISRLTSTADTENIPDFGSPADQWKSDIKGTEPPVLASTLLDQVSKSKEAAVPEPSVSTSNLLSNILRANSDVASSPNKRPTVDSLLSKILKG